MEIELLQRCIHKDKDAWDEFVDRYSAQIYRHIYSCLRAHAFPIQPFDVEDLFHSVFQALLEEDCKKLRQFERRCSLQGWIRMITTSVVIDYLRRQRRMIPLGNGDPDGSSLSAHLQDPGPSAEEDLLDRQRRALVRKALEGAPAEDRLLAVLAYLEERPVEEIMSILKISREAVYTRKHRLAEKFRKILQAKGLMKEP